MKSQKLYSSEANIQKSILLNISRGLSRLFRVNVGRAWTGSSIIKITQKNQHTFRLVAGDTVIKQARPFKTGVPNGFSDLVGFTSKVITQEMVGQQVAVFTAIEVKSERGRLSPDQENFINQVKNAGGLAGVARSPEEAESIID